MESFFSDLPICFETKEDVDRASNLIAKIQIHLETNFGNCPWESYEIWIEYIAQILINLPEPYEDTLYLRQHCLLFLSKMKTDQINKDSFELIFSIIQWNTLIKNLPFSLHTQFIAQHVLTTIE
jgi:hypothetical protein